MTLDAVVALRKKLRSPINRACLDYWSAKRDGSVLPGRADIDPLEMHGFLLNIVLLDVLRDPLDFRYRLVGGTVRSHLNDNLQGRSMRAIPHQAPPGDIFDSCQRVVETREPRSSEAPYVGPHRGFLVSEDLMLPLASDGREVDMLLLTIDFLTAAVVTATVD
ncbi:MAG: PAS domain-containing protein [Alphaproteobacteria bacterium]|nr:PAS domain-containing protein [Alphaproteobacteria bacterium]